jgi:Arc/MetJ-type ribon-helix-helix transcriptional regulator
VAQTKPSQFRLAEGTLAEMDRLGGDLGLASRADVIRAALRVLADAAGGGRVRRKVATDAAAAVRAEGEAAAAARGEAGGAAGSKARWGT